MSLISSRYGQTAACEKKEKKKKKVQKQSLVDKKRPRKRGSTTRTVHAVLTAKTRAFSKHFPRFAHADNAALPRTCITTKGFHTHRTEPLATPLATFFFEFFFGRGSCFLRHALVFLPSFCRARIAPSSFSFRRVFRMERALCSFVLTCLVARFASSRRRTCDNLSRVSGVCEGGGQLAKG